MKKTYITLISSLLLFTLIVGATNGLTNNDVNDRSLTTSQADTPNYTADEVVSIALAIDEVRAWSDEVDAFWDASYISEEQIWIVQFFPNNPDVIEWMEVLINDVTGEILDYYFMSNSEPYPTQNNVLLDQAIAYTQNLDILSAFLVDHPNLEWYGYEWVNYICDEYDCYEDTSETRVQIESYDSLTNTYLSSSLIYQQIDSDTFSFELSFVSANTIFGSPQFSFSEIEQLALDVPEAQEYINASDNYQISVSLAYIQNIGNLSQSYYFNGFPTDPGYYYLVSFNPNYFAIGAPADPISDDQSNDAVEETVIVDYNQEWLAILMTDDGTVLDIFGTSTATLTENQINDIILSNSDFSDWLADLDEYSLYSSFDGYDTWYFSINIPDNYYDYAWGEISDSQAALLNYDIFISIPPVQTEKSIFEVIQNDKEISDWLSNSDHYEYWAWYDGYGQWYVYIYDTIYFSDYVSLTIDDVSLEILNKSIQQLPLPNLDENEAINIFLDNGLDEFLRTYENAIIFFYYDGYGNWYVSAYDPVLIEAYYYSTLDDQTGEIIEKYVNHPSQLPTKTVDEIWSILHSFNDYKDVIEGSEIQYEYIYYYNGVWELYIEFIDQDHQYNSYYARIDDVSGEVLEFGENYYVYYAEDTLVASEGTSSNTPNIADNLAGFDSKQVPLDRNQNLKPYEIDQDFLNEDDQTQSNGLPGFTLITSFAIVSYVFLRKKVKSNYY